METDQQFTRTIQKAAVVPGLIYGIVSLAMAIFSFYFATTMATSMMAIIGGPFLFSFIVPIVAAIFLVLDLRKKIGGYWNFRQAVTGIFIMFFIASVVTFVGNNLIFAKFVEPNMVQKMEDKYVAATETMLEKSGADQAKIDEQLDKVKSGFESKKDSSAGEMAKGFLISIIITFVFALIFAAIFKKDPPLYDTGYNQPDDQY